MSFAENFLSLKEIALFIKRHISTVAPLFCKYNSVLKLN